VIPPPLPEQLACPRCRRTIGAEGTELICDSCGRVGSWVDGVWDFVGKETYADSFGRQWATFRETQLDSRNGTTISRDQFHRVTGWTRADLDGMQVLDGGCGAGRFAEVALSLGALVTGLDLSAAAYVTNENLRHDTLTVVRGNLLSPPVKERWFDRVFSFGVVQSTHDPIGAAQQLARMVRPGGQLAIWMYDKRWSSRLLPRTMIRPVTRRLSPKSVLSVSKVLVAAFTPAARAAGHLKSPQLRRIARAALPIASYWGELPLDDARQREWSLLDTHDWLSPTYNLPQTFETVGGAAPGREKPLTPD
jgi:2-polyprenyl-3-methyl-5-hydroxy-6-metoxy-1,4-benzoquinol methylase